MTGTHLSTMVQIARWGLPVAPSMMMHDEKGAGMIYMDGDGFRFMPFDKTKGPLVVTWEEFDAGEQDAS